MDCHDDSSSTINNLPNELLSKIFTTLTVATIWQNPGKLPSSAFVSSVCSHWRIVAQHTPELWVDINVPLHKSLEDCTRWTADWIARSGVLPISVVIDDATSRNMLPHLANIMSLLSQHSGRLRHLALHSTYSSTIQIAFSLLRSAPNLEQLTINCFGYSSSWFQAENRSQRQYSLDFPRLTILKTAGSMVSPIPNLTSLTIGELFASYNAISQYFTASPGLQHLTLYNLLPLENPPPHAALIRANSLRSLAVNLRSSQPGRQPPYIFKYLAMPNIKYLELDGNEWTVSDFEKSLSSVELDVLLVSHRSSFAADTINFLHSFSTVQHLQLVNTYDEGLLFKNITTAIQPTHSASTTVWPRLRITTFDKPTAEGVLDLCNFIPSHKRLQVVELSPATRRHLSERLRRKGDSVYQHPSLLVAAGSKEGLEDVEEWLGKMVDIRTLHSPSVGLVAAERHYLINVLEP